MHEGAGKVSSYMMYGAALSRKAQSNRTEDLKRELDSCKGEKDIVCSLFKELEQSEQIHYPYNIWLKFDGEGNDRLSADEPFPSLNGSTSYSASSNQNDFAVTRFEYKEGSIKGLVETEIGALGEVSEYAYDAKGRLIASDEHGVHTA